MAKFRVRLKEVNILYAEVEADSPEEAIEQADYGHYDVVSAEVSYIEVVDVEGEA